MARCSFCAETVKTAKVLCDKCYNMQVSDNKAFLSDIGDILAYLDSLHSTGSLSHNVYSNLHDMISELL